MNMKKLTLIIIFLLAVSCVAAKMQVAASGARAADLGQLPPDVQEAIKDMNITADVEHTADGVKVKAKVGDSNINIDANKDQVKADIDMPGNGSGVRERIRIEGNTSDIMQNKRVQMQFRNHSMNIQAVENADGTYTVNMSNGKKARVKVMPDVASKTAIERLNMNFCSENNSCRVELKAVGQGNNTKVSYKVEAKKKAKLFGIFGTQMDVEAEVDAETGEVINTKKPWWAFLASE